MTGPKWGRYYVGPLQFMVCYGAVIASTLLGGQCMKVNHLIPFFFLWLDLEFVRLRKINKLLCCLHVNWVLSLLELIFGDEFYLSAFNMVPKSCCVRRCQSMNFFTRFFERWYSFNFLLGFWIGGLGDSNSIPCDGVMCEIIIRLCLQPRSSFFVVKKEKKN